VDWACVPHLSFCFEETLYRTFHKCFLPNFNQFGQMDLKKIYFNWAITDKKCLCGSY
jgi:hypothetical protein